MKVRKANPDEYEMTLTWDEGRIIANAMMATLGGDILYTEYQTRVGGKVDEVTQMIYAIQSALRTGRHQHRSQGRTSPKG